MNYEDIILVRLADATSRASIFDQLALEQLLATAYDTEQAPVEGPFQPVFSEFSIGFNSSCLGRIQGGWNALDGSDRTEAKFQLSGITGNRIPRIDALWRGEIIGRTVSTTSRIIDLQTNWPSLGNIDLEIEADLGRLPEDELLLEQERRARFLTIFRETLDQPDTFTEETLDKWLDSIPAKSVSELLTQFKGTSHGNALQIAFSPPGSFQSSPRRLPIAAVILIRDSEFSIAQLIMESKFIREQLESYGLERSPDPSLPIRNPLLVVWVVPISLFDDPDWPGSGEGLSQDELRTARRRLAGQWLAREGIGLVTTTSP